jgi:hypothetical protein
MLAGWLSRLSLLASLLLLAWLIWLVRLGWLTLRAFILR